MLLKAFSAVRQSASESTPRATSARQAFRRDDEDCTVVALSHLYPSEAIQISKGGQ
jgi:hypothetical protein